MRSPTSSSAARWARVQAIARYQVRATGDALHPAVVASLAGLTLAAEPWDDALSFGYPQLRWRPEPVLQSYSAYTPYLDGLDASFLASPGAPQRILYQHVALDDRDPFWDPPSAMVAMYCHYRQLYVSGPWQVLGRPLTAAARSRWWAAPAPASASPSTSPSNPATSSWLRSRSAHRSWPGPKAFS